MSTEHLLARDLERLNDTIDRLEAELRTTSPNDPLKVGDRLELNLLRHHRMLLTELINSGGDLGTILEICRRRLRAAEREHADICANGQVYHRHHDDEWWDTEDRIDYLADLIRQIEAALERFAPP